MIFCQQNCKPLRICTFQEKNKKFNRRKHKKEKWMSNDLLLQIVKKNKKYVKWKSTPIGYEPAGLTVHPPPPRMIVGGFIFFVWVSSTIKIFSSKKKWIL